MKTVQEYKKSLAEIKEQIDTELNLHSRALQKSTAQNFTPYSVAVVDAYMQILARGGKRIRGALTVVGYQMCGGTNQDMILQAACAIEMTHAYILVLDDIMDKSVMRRGGASAHMILADYHKKHELSGESYHFGEATAINGALIGGNYAQSLALSLDASADNKLHALKLLNDALIVTGHGQINDIFNEVVDLVDEQAVDQVLEWKTAHYSFLNPLQFGMALAGADDIALAQVYDFCMHAGRAFQITDDILGTFSSELEAGKRPMDDIREGKRTVLSVAALNRATSSDKNFLITMLGNNKLTQAEFARCKEIFIDSGALQYSQNQAKFHIAEAVSALGTNSKGLNPGSVTFLESLVTSLLGRSS